MMLKAESMLNVGYQKILTFERPGGGFDWWGRDPALVWLTAYGIQQLTALSKVKEIDMGVIERARNFLREKRQENGSWGNIGNTHSETISYVAHPEFALTSYVVWSLAKAGFSDLNLSCRYLHDNIHKAKNNPYLLSLAANALLSVNSKDQVGLDILQQLCDIISVEKDMSYWKTTGKTASYAYGDAANVEVTALAILAMIEAKSHTEVVNKALQYIVKSRLSSGTWGSTQSTILALQSLVSCEALSEMGGDANIEIVLNDEKIDTWKISDANREVMQILDLAEYTRTGTNSLKLNVTGNPNVMYQVVTRHYKPWPKNTTTQKPVIDLDVTYDRTTLSKHDTIIAAAKLKYNGTSATYMVIIDLGIPPGFDVDRGDFAELLGENVIKRYSVTSSQVTLYLGDVKPGDELQFSYHLKAKYPLKAKTPKSSAYEYYSPDVRAESKPQLIEVTE